MSELNGSKELSRGELRAQWRERHLCLKCAHHTVCKMADAIDPNHLVVVSQCLAFDPAEPPDEGDKS